MIGKWIDITIFILVALSTFRGFRRGLIREAFSLLGSLLAVAVAYQGYQELSLHLMIAYPLNDWQAQLIAFVILVLGISLTAILFGYIWSKIVRLTPFAVVDNLAGAGFGMLKVAVIVIICVTILSSLEIPPINNVLEESMTAQQVYIVWPRMNKQLEEIWPKDWPKPAWLFPTGDLQTNSNLYV